MDSQRNFSIAYFLSNSTKGFDNLGHVDLSDFKTHKKVFIDNIINMSSSNNLMSRARNLYTEYPKTNVFVAQLTDQIPTINNGLKDSLDHEIRENLLNKKDKKYLEILEIPLSDAVKKPEHGKIESIHSSFEKLVRKFKTSQKMLAKYNETDEINTLPPEKIDNFMQTCEVFKVNVNQCKSKSNKTSCCENTESLSTFISEIDNVVGISKKLKKDSDVTTSVKEFIELCQTFKNYLKSIQNNKGSKEQPSDLVCHYCRDEKDINIPSEDLCSLCCDEEELAPQKLEDNKEYDNSCKHCNPEEEHTKIRTITKVTRFLNPDGSIQEEREVMTIKQFIEDASEINLLEELSTTEQKHKHDQGYKTTSQEKSKIQGQCDACLQRNQGNMRSSKNGPQKCKHSVSPENAVSRSSHLCDLCGENLSQDELSDKFTQTCNVCRDNKVSSCDCNRANNKPTIPKPCPKIKQHQCDRNKPIPEAKSLQNTKQLKIVCDCGDPRQKIRDSCCAEKITKAHLPKMPIKPEPCNFCSEITNKSKNKCEWTAARQETTEIGSAEEPKNTCLHKMSIKEKAYILCSETTDERENKMDPKSNTKRICGSCSAKIIPNTKFEPYLNESCYKNSKMNDLNTYEKCNACTVENKIKSKTSKDMCDRCSAKMLPKSKSEPSPDASCGTCGKEQPAPDEFDFKLCKHCCGENQSEKCGILISNESKKRNVGDEGKQSSLSLMSLSSNSRLAISSKDSEVTCEGCGQTILPLKGKTEKDTPKIGRKTQKTKKKSVLSCGCDKDNTPQTLKIIYPQHKSCACPEDDQTKDKTVLGNILIKILPELLKAPPSKELKQDEQQTKDGVPSSDTQKRQTIKEAATQISVAFEPLSELKPNIEIKEEETKKEVTPRVSITYLPRAGVILSFEQPDQKQVTGDVKPDEPVPEEYGLFETTVRVITRVTRCLGPDGNVQEKREVITIKHESHDPDIKALNDYQGWDEKGTFEIIEHSDNNGNVKPK